jgi:hypothetical protein
MLFELAPFSATSLTKGDSVPSLFCSFEDNIYTIKHSKYEAKVDMTTGLITSLLW